MIGDKFLSAEDSFDDSLSSIDSLLDSLDYLAAFASDDETNQNVVVCEPTIICANLSETDAPKKRYFDDSSSSDDSASISNVSGKKRSKYGGAEDDEAFMAIAIEKHLLSMNLNPLSIEGKREKRRVRNRLSAQLHRERKRAYIGSLEEQLLEKDRLIEHLEKENKRLRQGLSSGLC